MKIIMSKDFRGSIDGVNVKTYKQSVEYDIPESLALVFLEINVAEKVTKEIKIETPEKPVFMETAALKPMKRKGRPKGSKNKK